MKLLAALVALDALLAAPGCLHEVQGAHAGIPPVEARTLLPDSFLVAGPQLRARVKVDTAGKRVTLEWMVTFEAPSESVPFVGNVIEPQEVAVGYWPTTAEAVAPLTLLVAGKVRGGNTRIEVWTVAPPILGIAQGPTGPVYSLEQQPLVDIDTVYEAADPTRDMVKAIFRLRGKPAAALIQFDSSRDLYELGWQDPYPLSLVMSSATLPALASPGFDHAHSGDHQSLGYVYVFSSEEDPGAADPLVLVDQDRDGIVDAFNSMTMAQYIQAGLNDYSQYAELYGIPHDF